MKAISIRSPWWWYILNGGKDIENRDWPTAFRGRVLIHASKWWSGNSVMDDISGIHSRIIEPQTIITPRLSDMHPYRGQIVGSVEIVDCVSSHNSRWFFGRYGFVLRNPIELREKLRFKGALGFFDVPDGRLAQ
jgi:hypothetical protein